VRGSCACPRCAYVAAWKLEASPQHAPPSTLPASLISHQTASAHAAASPELHPMHHRSGKAVHREPLCDPPVRYCSSPLSRPFPQGPQQARPCKPKCATAGRPADLSIESAAVGPADQKTDKGGAADQKTPLKGEVFTSRSRDDSPSCPRSPLLPFQVGVACGGGSSPLVDGPDDE